MSFCARVARASTCSRSAQTAGSSSPATTTGLPRIWDARSGALQRSLRGHDGVIRDVSYSDDGRSIATAGSDGTVRIWPVRGGDGVILVGHESTVSTVRFNARGDRVVSAGVDGTVRVWDVAGGESLVVLQRYEGDASGADFGTRGRWSAPETASSG